MTTGFPINLREAASAMGAVLQSTSGSRVLTGVSTDSRTIKPGELFFALKGDNFDGANYINAAFDKGAAAAVVSAGPTGSYAGPCLIVSDALTGLGDLAACFRKLFTIPMVAITGSNGKTTTKEMLAGILEQSKNVLAAKGNFNNLIGLPLTLLRLRQEHQVAVLELGMNIPGEIARLTQIASPDVGLVTNVGPAHIEGLGSLEGVARAKGELFEGLGARASAVVNLDDPLVEKIAESHKGPKVTFGFTDEADIRGKNYRLKGFKGASFELIAPQGDAVIELQLLGRHNVRNALAAAAAALVLGASLEDVAAGIAGSAPYPGRLALKTLEGPVYLIDDAYNSNPASSRAALEILADLREDGRTIAVMGDMLELGVISEQEHVKAGLTALEFGIDILAAVGPLSRDSVDAVLNAESDKTKALWFPDTDQAAAWLDKEIKPNDRILIKGSRGMKMENIIRQLAYREEAAA